MISQKITVNNPSGLHLRPAGALCNEAIKYDSRIELICDGTDEQAAMEALISAISSGLGE